MGNLEDTRIGLEVDTSKVAPALDEVPDAVDDTIAEVDSRWSKISDVLGEGAKVAGTAAGAALIAGAIEGMDREAGSDKIAAQLRLDPAEQKVAGDLAGSLYAGAYAESFEQAETAVASVGDLLTGFDDQGALDRVSAKALDYAATFDEDVTDAVGRASQLIRDGLARDADAAFDLMVASAQDVPAHLRGEATDALTEYGKSFQQLGIDGSGALALISSADDQYTLDKTGDALKELTIRATDMSDASQSAFETIGLSGSGMARAFVQGGDQAKWALGETVDALLAVEDPVERSNAAIALFGTPLEDLGTERIPAFLESLGAATSATGDLEGRADELGETLNSNTKTSVTGVARGIENWIVGLTEADGAVGTVATGIGGLAVAAQPVAPMMTGLGLLFQNQIGTIASAVGTGAGKVGSAFLTIVQRGAAMAVSFATSAASMIASSASWVATQVANGVRAAGSMAVTAGKFVAHYARMAVASLVNAAKMAASWVIAMGPVGWVIAGVVGLVALIVANWDKVKEWTGRAWQWVGDKVAGVWRWISSTVTGVGDRVVGFVRDLPGRFMSGLASLGTTVLSFVERYHPAAILARKAIELWPTVRDWLRALPGKIVDQLSGLGTLLVDKGGDLVSGLWDGIRGMGRWLADKVAGFVTDFIPGPIARALGISSPSKVAAALAAEVPRGMVVGMESEAGALQSMSERLASAALPSLLSMPRVGSLEPATFGASSTGERGPLVNVERMEVTDRRDADRVARELAWLVGS